MTWAPDYATSDDLKAYIHIDDTVDDDQIALAIAAASRAVDVAANRQFGLVAAVQDRFYTAEFDRRRGRWVVDVDDMMTESGLLVAYDAADDGTFTSNIDGFRLLPANAAAESRPWTQIVVQSTSTNLPGAGEYRTRVTAQFGWTTVPIPIRQATLMQASRLIARRDAPFGVAGSPEVGSEMRLLARLDEDVAVIVNTYRRWWGAV